MLMPACARWNRPSDEVWEKAAREALAAELKHVPPRGNLGAFYRARGGAPAWIKDRAPGGQADELVERLGEVEKDGLSPASYPREHLQALMRALREADGRERGAPVAGKLDVLLSDSFLKLAGDLAYGSVNPKSIRPEWALEREGPRLSDVLRNVVGGEGVGHALDALAPTSEGYRLLAAELTRDRDIARAGGWPRLPPGPNLREGMKDGRVPLLRRRLATTGYLSSSAATQGDRYDDKLARAVEAFQARNGLEQTGELDKRTLSRLNVPVEDRIAEIRLNLERWRWLPRDLGERYVFVDIANFRLTVFEKKKAVFSMAIVVGKDSRETPVFDDEIRYLVLNPTWRLPKSIVVNELAPRLARDPSELARKGMKIFEGKREIAASDVDWSSVREDDFPYTVSQPPGRDNPLGSIKFMFPNEFAVYLHGTPARRTFRKQVRAESHGCIRVEDPLRLAEYLLRDNVPKWDRKRIVSAIQAGEERTVSLTHPTPVYLFYWTAWVDEKKHLNVRPDIYGWDRPVLAALSRAARPDAIPPRRAE
jgi:murein L,D-transpeptidase YcbB/YkuD